MVIIVRICFSAQTNSDTNNILNFLVPNSKLQLKCKLLKYSNSKDFKIEGMNVYKGNIKIYGAICSIPKFCIKSMDLFVDSSKISIPEKYLIDIGNPNFLTNPYKSFYIEYNTDQNCVFIFMNGGDGAGVYSVLWVVNISNGVCNRFIKQTGDYSFFNLY